MREDQASIDELIAMTPEKAQALQAHISAIAAILYEETHSEQLTTLESLEATIRQQVLEHITPQFGVFLLRRSQVQPQGAPGTSKAV